MPWDRAKYCLNQYWLKKGVWFLRYQCVQNMLRYLKTTCFFVCLLKVIFFCLFEFPQQFYRMLNIIKKENVYTFEIAHTWVEVLNLSWYGHPAQSFDHHPIAKPEKMQNCSQYLNHLFFKGPVF